MPPQPSSPLPQPAPTPQAEQAARQRGRETVHGALALLTLLFVLFVAAGWRFRDARRWRLLAPFAVAGAVACVAIGMALRGFGF